MRSVTLYDTTLRDGTQGEGISLSLDDKLKIAERLDHFGVHYIEGGWPGSNPKDLGFFKEVKKLKLKNAKVAAFGSTRRADTKVEDDANVKALLEAETKVVTVFGKSWDLHVTEVFKTTLEENLNMIYDTVAFFKKKKLEVVYDAEHFFDGYFANPEYAMKTIKKASEAGCDLISLCDTNGGTLPSQIKDIMEKLKKEVKTPLGIHCHNDSGLAVANSVAAVEAGAVQVQGTTNGYGERCGNANLTTITAILKLKMDVNCVSDEKLKGLTDMSRFVSEIANQPVEGGQPFVGTSAFAHKGGVHVNAMVKNVKTYEHISPELVGNKTRFLISELSGKTNVLIKAKELGLDLKKDTPETKKILEKVQKLENEGYHFEAAEASLELLMKKMTGRHKKFFELTGFRVLDEKTEDDRLVSEATIKVKVDGVEEHTAATGDGPVNALDNALRKALVKFYPVIKKVHLTDFKVRVINSEAGTAAKVRVFVQYRDEKESWSTIGVSENIIEASWHALVEAIEYKLLKTQ